MSDIKTVSIDQLREWLANAFITGATCLGHTKTARNNWLMEKYRKELIDRGEKIPELGLYDGDKQYRKKLFEQGVFNGPGSC